MILFLNNIYKLKNIYFKMIDLLSAFNLNNSIIFKSD